MTGLPLAQFGGPFGELPFDAAAEGLAVEEQFGGVAVGVDEDRDVLADAVGPVPVRQDVDGRDSGRQ